MRFSRRGMLIAALAGGGLMVGYLARPRSFPLPLTPGRNEIAFDAWIKIAHDGVISVAVPQLEMGQGVTSLIAQVVAMELGADWRQIAIEPSPVSAHYANLPLAARWSELWMPAFASLADSPDDLLVRRWAEDNRFMATADGMSMQAFEMPAREAAAGVRAMLAMAAAERWDVSWEECEARQGFIEHGENRASFAELATEAAAYDPPEPPPLRPEAMNAKSAASGVFPRIDLPSKVDGSYQFAGDVRMPDMVFASVHHAPVGKAALGEWDKSAASKIAGLIDFVEGPDWLAAIGSNWWAAEQALRAAGPHFDVSRFADSSVIGEALDKALRHGEETRLRELGDPDELLEEHFDLVVRYEVAPALHGTVETTSATARFADGKLELWMGCQAPQSAREVAAHALGIDVRDVVLYAMPAGGSFDRRLEVGHAAEAALIAKHAGKPVQVTWSRWQEHLAGWPRTPVAALMGARTDVEGRLAGWRARIAVPATVKEFGKRLFGRDAPFDAIDSVAGEIDPLAMEGAIPPYALANLAIEQVPVSIGLPTARLRGNAHGYTAFFNETFIDELAHQANREPLAYRMALLGKEPRLAECLQRVAALAEWGGGSDSSGQGLACHVIGEGEGAGRIAVVATARRADSGVRVDKISAVVDIGRIVNEDIARQQIEGGLVFGLGLAIGSSSDYERGLPTARRLSHLNLPLLADCPQIEVEFIASDAPSADPGELGVVAAPPAIGNALYSATGLRFRRLPLLSDGL
ncbi:MAG: xanthine dehydrogenase family protein molybdopterin-binding subunit [Novosphingobium sp.]|nr:xanthine dehydrogenase family protein molybdopterin-binding subunit [Novosphingobium sp.]